MVIDIGLLKKYPVIESFGLKLNFATLKFIILVNSLNARNVGKVTLILTAVFIFAIIIIIFFFKNNGFYFTPETPKSGKPHISLGKYKYRESFLV